MLMTCTDAIPSIQPSWLPGMSNFPFLSFPYVLKTWGEATGFAYHGAGVSAVQLLMRPTQYWLVGHAETHID